MAARLIRALARLAAGVCLGLLVVLLVDLVLAPPDIPMLLLAGGALVATAVFAVRVLWPLRARPADRRVARLVEEWYPELEDRVASATALGDADPSTVFDDLVVADAAEKLRGVDLGRVVTPARLRDAALHGVLAMTVLAVILAMGSSAISRVVRTAWLYAFPFNVTLEVEPGDVRVMAGQPLRVRARLLGTRGALARTPPTLTFVDGHVPRAVAMRATADGYLAEFPSVTDSFIYHVSAATLTSRDYRVEALVPPRVRRIDLEYTYLPFTGLAPHLEEDGGDIYAPAGTEVRLRVHTDKAIVEGALVLSDGRRVPLEGAGDGPLTAALSVEEDGSYTIVVTDTDGLGNTGDVEYFIRTTVDRSPDVQVLRPGGDREITPLEEVLIEVQADDDYRIAALELVYTVVGRGEQSVAFDTPARASTVTGTWTLYAEDLAVEPGDFITYYARARDVGRAGQSTEARSDIFFLEIRPFNREYEEAQRQAGMGRDAEDVGNLVVVQKEIIVATWRLDRQHPSAAVTDDIRAVGEAQRELRDTTARAAGRTGLATALSAGDGGLAPGNVALASAVEAMTAAQSTLEALRTDKSIPHEMMALNQLLKARAAISRRQMSTQQAPGSQTSGNQAQEDLSALFDLELRRDQETNYEIETSPGDRRAGDESDALRRLGELAERQAEVNRELAEHEETPPSDELRRALERLTREQQELREQLEALADRDRFAGSVSAQGQSQEQPLDGVELHRIAGEMARATSELRREDARSARVRGDQALEQLRRLEQRVRGESDAEWSSAVAELQLEAQQLANAQRRVADEASQVKADNRGPESRFRLASEKDALAGRVDALGRALEDLAGAESRADPADVPVRAARDELEHEAVGRRMRAAADSLRRSVVENRPNGSGSGLERLASEEAALAEVLATVVAQLRRASGLAEQARQLAAQLQVAQELREGLGRLQAEEAARPGAERPEGRRGGMVDLAQLRREYVARLEHYQVLLDALRRESPELNRDLEQWARHWRGGSAPGIEAVKQDYEIWDSLRRNLENALQQFEAEWSRELVARESRNRLSAGPDEPLPERYRRLVDQYYRSLAAPPEPP